MLVTKLDLGAVHLVGGSDRSISESLEPIGESANLRRTINGRLVNTGDASFRKYRVSLSGSDLRPPALDGVWPGMQIEISTITELTKTDTSPVIVSRPSGIAARRVDLGRVPVPGSVFAKNASGVAVSIIEIEGSIAYLNSYMGVVYVTYRPRLSCMIESWSSDEDEANANSSWSLTALEV